MRKRGHVAKGEHGKDPNMKKGSDAWGTIPLHPMYGIVAFNAYTGKYVNICKQLFGICAQPQNPRDCQLLLSATMLHVIPLEKGT